MPASPTAIAPLEFGKLIYEEERRHGSDHDPAKLRQAEEQLIERLQSERSPLVKQILNFKVSKPIDPITLRVLSHVAYSSLCTIRLGITVSDVVAAVGGGEPATLLETRQTVSRLLIERQLLLRNNHILELGESSMTFLAGGKSAPPLSLTEWDLQRAWHQADAEAKRRKSREPIRFANMSSAKQLAQRIAKDIDKR